MPRLRTDDAIYHQKMYYRGPRGMTMPIDVTYPQLFFGAFVIGGLDILVAVFITPWAIFMATVVGAWITYAVGQKVTPDRPIRKVLKTAVTDWRRHPAGDTDATVTLSTRHLFIDVDGELLSIHNVPLTRPDQNGVGQ